MPGFNPGGSSSSLRDTKKNLQRDRPDPGGYGPEGMSPGAVLMCDETPCLLNCGLCSVTPEIMQAIKDKLPSMGIELIKAGKCPRGATMGHACMFCPCGHLTECHYPKTCEVAQCSHLARYNEEY